MQENFKLALTFTLKWEGEYSFDKNDPGGETKFGIAKKSHPDIDIKSLTLSEAEAIYYHEYWLSANCESMEWPLAMSVFDASVNCGVGRAKAWVAKSVVEENDARRNATLFNQERIAYYKGLVEKRPSLNKYINGWLNRVNDLSKYIDVASK